MNQAFHVAHYHDPNKDAPLAATLELRRRHWHAALQALAYAPKTQAAVGKPVLQLAHVPEWVSDENGWLHAVAHMPRSYQG